jgi:hypothetical protein
MSAVRLRALPSLLAALISLVVLGRAHASDNSYSSLEALQLMAKAGDRHISDTPPPPVPAPKPPSLQVLEQELATQEQTLSQQQAGLTSAQNMLSFFENQASQLALQAVAPGTPPDQQTQDAQDAQQLQATDIPEWTQAVASDEKLLAQVQLQITRLQAQIAAAQ